MPATTITLTLQGLKLTGRRADCYTIDDTVQVATDVTVEQATAPTVRSRRYSRQRTMPAPGRCRWPDVCPTTPEL